MAQRRSDVTMHNWNQVWMIEGHKLVCRSCRAKQWPAIDEGPFRHEETCALSQGGARFPWKELSEALQAELLPTRRMLH